MINKLKCSKCGEVGQFYCSDEWDAPEGEDGYYLRCSCGHYPTYKCWDSSDGPYDEAERLLAANDKLTDSRRPMTTADTMTLELPLAPETEKRGGCSRAAHGSASVLDVCCGSRMFWFDRKNPDAIFVDKRRERPNTS